MNERHHIKHYYRLWVPSYEYMSKPELPENLRMLRRRAPTPPVFVPHHQFGMFEGLENPGFQGIYLFDQRHLDFAYSYGEHWDGTQFPYSSNYLFFDFDREGGLCVERCERYFAGYDYLVYKSGGPDKYHFIVPHNLITNVNLQFCYQSFTRTAQLYIDFSAWAPHITITMPGQKHQDTGIPKTLVKANSGRLFQFPEDVTPRTMLDFGQSFFEGKI